MPVILACKKCSKPFKAYPSEGQKYCSRECAYRDREGCKNPAYKGGTVVDKNGYVRIRGTPCAQKRQYVHQATMEKILGRMLKPGEEVHHINGVKTDNRPENLFLINKREHSRKHFLLFVEVQKLRRENQLLREENERLKCP